MQSCNHPNSYSVTSGMSFKRELNAGARHAVLPSSISMRHTPSSNPRFHPSLTPIYSCSHLFLLLSLHRNAIPCQGTGNPGNQTLHPKPQILNSQRWRETRHRVLISSASPMRPRMSSRSVPLLSFPCSLDHLSRSPPFIHALPSSRFRQRACALSLHPTPPRSRTLPFLQTRRTASFS
jgi:hypothetical protein